MNEAWITGLRRGAAIARQAAAVWMMVGEVENARRILALAEDAERLARGDDPTREMAVAEPKERQR